MRLHVQHDVQVPGDGAAPLTLGAGIGNDLALAVAPVAQRDVDELAEDRLLDATDLSTTLAAGALRGLAAGLHAAAGALRARGVLGQPDLLAGAEDRFLERDVQVVTEVLAALDALSCAALTRRAEERLKK